MTVAKERAERIGSCIICAWRDPLPDLEPCCGPCRSKVRSWLGDIPDLHAELVARATLEETRDDRTVVARGKYGGQFETTAPRDPVAHNLPSGALPSMRLGGRVSGSAEPALPIRLDLLDLTGPARPITTTRSLDPDRIGYDSVASTLGYWVEAWRSDRNAGEGSPVPTVPVLVAWLLHRLDDVIACSATIREFFEDIRRIRNALRGQLGAVDIPDHKRGIPCPKCKAQTLVHRNGSKWIECDTCPAYISFDEYEAHVHTLATVELAKQRIAMRERRALRQLLTAMRAAGWRHSVRVDEEVPECRMHCWRRGVEAIELWTYADVQPFDFVSYAVNAEGAEPATITVSAGWIAEQGLAALHRLARVAGLLRAC